MLKPNIKVINKNILMMQLLLEKKQKQEEYGLRKTYLKVRPIMRRCMEHNSKVHSLDKKTIAPSLDNDKELTI
jgi:hypothetical protein